MQDLHLLPKLRDGWSYLYVDRCQVDQQEKAIVVCQGTESVPVPCAALAVLMLGPGSTITHAAIRALASNGCTVLWCGEGAVRFYAQGMGETRRSHRLLHQARLFADERARLSVVRKMYQMRFTEPIPASATLVQIRGMEGIRVRESYQRASKETNIEWKGRTYQRDRWQAADPINRALSAANSCLYGVCHAAIVSVGYSPALGFIHTGKMLSFVYDIADLYKTETTIPVAFRAVAQGEHDLEGRVRRMCRDAFVDTRLLTSIVTDMDCALGYRDETDLAHHFDTDAAAPGGLWDPESGAVEGGVNFADDCRGEPHGGDDP